MKIRRRKPLRYAFYLWLLKFVCSYISKQRQRQQKKFVKLWRRSKKKKRLYNSYKRKTDG